jgi:hypothetical protein
VPYGYEEVNALSTLGKNPAPEESVSTGGKTTTAYPDRGIALILLQKSWYVHREFLRLSHVILHSRVTGKIL